MKVKITKRMFVRDSCSHSSGLFTSCCSEKTSRIIPLKELSQGGTKAVGNWVLSYPSPCEARQHLSLALQEQVVENHGSEVGTRVLRCLDRVFQGQYLKINYVAIDEVLEKLPPQLY